MKKLKNKIFIVIFTILTISSFIILFIFNYQYYYNERKDIENNLIKLLDNKNNFDNKVFMDLDIYTVIYEDDDITNIIYHGNNDLNYDKLKIYAQKIINNQDKKMKIGNLYFNKYSYVFKNDNVLILIDNSFTNNSLITYLKTSISIFIILEIVILYLTKVLSEYLVKPVEDTFNKQKNFVADASHELKTPITVILANAETLENDRDNDKWLNNIKNESVRMNKLVNDLLTLSKTENDLIENNFKEEDLSKIVRKSLLTFESLMYEKNINLEDNIEDIKFKCDSDKIEEVMSILLDNAIKHSIKEGHIIVNLNKNKNNIILEVINKGEEISKEDEEKIFERFYRVDKARNRNENRYGLGLSIAKNIVISHNGDISASSKDGYTKFKIVFKI